MSHAVNQNQ